MQMDIKSAADAIAAGGVIGPPWSRGPVKLGLAVNVAVWVAQKEVAITSIINCHSSGLTRPTGEVMLHSEGGREDAHPSRPCLMSIVVQSSGFVPEKQLRSVCDPRRGRLCNA